ncbi:MAG: L-threonylcarbamoyladenylate synthase [Pseudonocardiaceae bacterium]
MDRDTGDKVVARAISCLLDGGVILLPTDTVYGLAVHPMHDDAAARLFAMKRRPRTRNLPIMVSSVDDLDDLAVEINEAARHLMETFFPGPLTVALGLREASAPHWLAGRTEVAIRVPDDKELRTILETTGPLLVTSANVHAQATPESVESILATLDGEPDLVIDGGVRPVIPSTLVNCNLPTPVIERAGALSEAEIERALR